MPPNPKTPAELEILELIKDLTSTVKRMNEGLRRTYDFVESSVDIEHRGSVSFVKHDLFQAEIELSKIQEKLKALGINP